MNEHETNDATSGSIQALLLRAEPPPLRLDEGGVIRIGRSRVSLDLIVEQYENGMTPEDIVRAYDAVNLADVYAAIAWFLRNREAADAYLAQRAVEAETLREKIEAERPNLSREELMARRNSQKTNHAPVGE